MPAVPILSGVLLYVHAINRLRAFYSDEFGLEIDAGHTDQGVVAFETWSRSLCLRGGRKDGSSVASTSKVVFAVSDLAVARQGLREHSVDLDAVRSEVPGVEIVDGTDPEGNRFAIEAGVDQAE